MTSIVPFPSLRGRFDLSAYVVVGPRDCHGRPLTDVVRAGLAGGATSLQLRAKDADAADRTAMARGMADAIAAAGASDRVPLVIDDRVDVAWQARRLGIKVDGAHIGQTDMDPRQARALLGDEAIVGLSAETADLVRIADALPAGTIDYIGAGPLHVSVTKPEASVGGNDGSGHTLDAAQIDALCEATDLPVVVGGGVTAADMPMLAATKAAGWFAVSAIAGAADPEAATRAMAGGWRAVRGNRTAGTPSRGVGRPAPRVTTLPPVLAVSGSDSSGGAGAQADLKTMLVNGVFGMNAITALTAQNTTGVRSIQDTDPAILADQIDAVFEDIPPLAVKIGMVSSTALIETIADRLVAHQARNVVLDPVMVATSGAKLISDDAIAALTGRLFPLATVITPNVPETQVLLEVAESGGNAPVAMNAADWRDDAPETIHDARDMERAALAVARRFGCAVLVKGGHAVNDANDVLGEPDGTVTWFPGERVDNPNTHGTGCTLSSAIAANLAKGATLAEAIRRAKAYLTGALKAGLDLGHGSGPMDHAWRWR